MAPATAPGPERAMLLGDDRRRYRDFFRRAWGRRDRPAELSPLERLVIEVIDEHPEHRPSVLEGGAFDGDRASGAGGTNPFLHLGMHVAIREQLAADRPAGFRSLYRDLLRDFADAHRLEHAIMECLGATLWEAGRGGRAPDEGAYLECVRRLGRR